MDFIKLERIEPFQKPSQRSTPKPKPKAPRLTTFNGEEYKGVHSDLNSQFSRLRTKTFEPLPIPPQVIPTMAFVEQVNKYEKMFFQDGDRVDNLNMKLLLSPFNDISIPPCSSRPDHFGKILFLTKLLVKINKGNMNYDPAIVCCDHGSEQKMLTHLSAAKFNVRALSEMFPQGDIYGVIVKIRKTLKNPKKFTPIIRNEVDSIFVYDSACRGNVDKEMKLLKGIGGRKPIIFYIACMDTIDMRIHTYNRCSSVPVSWDTKVGNLSHDLQQSLLLQPNRRSTHIATVAWNDYLAQTVFNWIIARDAKEYVFKFPSKGVLLLEVNSFLLHHPYTEFDPKYASTIPINTNIQSGQQAASNRSSVLENRAFDTAVAPKSKPSAVKPTPNPKTNHRGSSKAASTSTIRPDVMPGIHPERMIMISSDKALNTTGLKRQRDCEETEVKQPAKVARLKPLPRLPNIEPERKERTIESNDHVSMEEPAVATTEADASSSTVATEEQVDAPTETTSLVADFTTKFNDFFTNALKKFENDIRGIKL